MPQTHPLHIALIGAGGFVGSAILTELLSRGPALVRDPSRHTPHDGLRLVQADVMDHERVASVIAGQHALISAYNAGWDNPNLYADYMAGTREIVSAMKRAELSRLLAIGGAGSLYVAPGVQLIDTPEFPAGVKDGASAARDALNLLQREPTLDWTVLSPPAHLTQGERTGIFRMGGDALLMAADGPAGISTADLAVAAVDEIETPAHIRRRFTVAY